jgi:hypothetical protein
VDADTLAPAYGDDGTCWESKDAAAVCESWCASAQFAWDDLYPLAPECTVADEPSPEVAFALLYAERITESSFTLRADWLGRWLDCELDWEGHACPENELPVGMGAGTIHGAFAPGMLSATLHIDIASTDQDHETEEEVECGDHGDYEGSATYGP